MDEQNNVMRDPPVPDDAAFAIVAARKNGAAKAETEDVRFSNAIRLTGHQWLIAGAISAVILGLGPTLWRQVEPCELETDHRMPHDLSNDYWLYERFAQQAVARCDTLLIGDSVVWGEYVTPDETLSHYLNELEGKERYANLGLDGAHPLALSGLVEHYLGSVSNKNVVLQCNPLWMSSRRADLQDDKATEFNHPRLVPQFVPRIPSYPLTRENVSDHIGIVVEQHVPLNSWTTHLQQTCYNQSDIPRWTLEHPYDNLLRPLTRGLPPVDGSRRHPSRPWYKNDITKQDFPWVEMESSLQWRAFQEVVKLLQQRGNRVFVLVGPFNEHMLVERSRVRYQKVKETIAAWLETEQVPHLVPRPLDSEEYGDASHPLAAGYEALARQLRVEPFFHAMPSQP
jgi:hypothetical protein